MSTIPSNIGRYEIVAELGRGAMGVVYQARDPAMDRLVAVKTILAAALSGDTAQGYRERFLREARAAGRLNHPGIVTVHDVGEHDGTPFIVMELVRGRTLDEALASGARMSLDRVCALGRELADALGYAHGHGVIHRDIKPANIILAAAPRGADDAATPAIEHAKIADFGVARLPADQLTATGQMLGTPAFMAPEQFTGAQADGRSDLFSLGVVLYWMATGEKPFVGDTLTAVSYRIVHGEAIPPSRLNPAVPAALEQVILALMEKDPARRYATGEALAAALDALVAGRTPVPPPAADSLTRTRPARFGTPGPPPPAPVSAGGFERPAADAAVPPPVPGSGRRFDFWQTLLLAVLAAAMVVLVGLQLRRDEPRAPASVAGTDDAVRATPPAPTISADGGEAGAGAEAVEPDTTVPAPAAGAIDEPSGDRSLEPSRRRRGEGAGAGVAVNEVTPDRVTAEPTAAAPEAGPAAVVTTGPVEEQVAPPPRGRTVDVLRRRLTAALLDPAAPNPSGLTDAQRQAVARALERPPPVDRARMFRVVSGVPGAISYVVEMDGRPLRGSQAGARARGRRGIPAEGRAFDVSLVPPGGHVFRAVLRNGQRLLLASETVSGEFAGGDDRMLRIVLTGDLRRLVRPGSAVGPAPALRISLE